ncbi:E3 ubiquitin-protein ligase makorin-1 [Heterocephalus glaber]|uniref:E3 ubiquitin-protein ligase makorin-1 n=1 Tax=Heterocephalus glaber TaxID=10181 RepID=G5BCT7_HETGA|nr:E3 ubiquitin-protein ligase makorin-1 [Heterocephalus glaber]
MFLSGEARYFMHRVCKEGDNCRYSQDKEEPQRQKVGTSSRYWVQQRNHFWELTEERENRSPFDNDEEEAVTFELDKMLLMLLAASGGNELTDTDNEWDLFHDKLEDFCDLDLYRLCMAWDRPTEPQTVDVPCAVWQ